MFWRKGISKKEFYEVIEDIQARLLILNKKIQALEEAITDYKYLKQENTRLKNRIRELEYEQLGLEDEEDAEPEEETTEEPQEKGMSKLKLLLWKKIRGEKL